MTKKLEISLGRVRISFDFNDVDQLNRELANIDQVKKIVEEKLGHIMAKRKVSEDIRDVCESVDDYIRLNKVPKQKNDKAILAIYCYGPAGATLEEIQYTSGISNPSKNVINNGDNGKYFMSLKDGIYGLSALGLETAIKIIADLRKVPIETESKKNVN